MSIRFACPCGRQFKVPDQYAGKPSKCPTCGVALVIPALVKEKPEVIEDVEVVEAEPEIFEGAEVVEEDEIVEEAEIVEETRPKKQKRKKRPAAKRGPLTAMYEAEAKEQMRRDEERRGRARSGRGGKDDGRTLFGVHITAGVLAGSGMLFVGLLCMAIIVIFKDEIVLGPRIFIGAMLGTVFGGIVLMRALLFGEED